MTFTPIDLRTWPRGQMFYYFSKMAPTGCSMTVSLDVTKLRKTLKEAGLKFFPAYLWLVTKNLNRQIEFKVAEKDGVLGFYDTLTPLYASFHQDDHTFSLMWTEEGGRTRMPLSVTCHHAATDGYHVNCFLDALQADMNDFGKYL